MKKVIFTLLLFVGFSVTANAQSEKMKAKAAKNIEKMQTMILGENSALTLSADQVKELTALEVKKLVEFKALKKKKATKEERRAVNKKYGKLITKVLSKEQLQAYRHARKNRKKKH